MIAICGERLVFDVSGALWVPGRRTLIVSDLHLEKGSSYARRGVALPPYDTRTTLARLARALRKYAPARVVSLGDSFDDRDGPARLAATDRDALRAMTAAHDWLWIAGNHEGLVDGADLGGRAEEVAELGRLTLRHEPRPAPATGEVSGHLHPCAVVSARGRRLRRRCFVTDATRLVMPAFGAYAGGLNALDRAFDPLFDRGFRAWLMGARDVYPVAAAKLVKDEAPPQPRTTVTARLAASAAVTRSVSRTR